MKRAKVRRIVDAVKPRGFAYGIPLLSFLQVSTTVMNLEDMAYEVGKVGFYLRAETKSGIQRDDDAK